MDALNYAAWVLKPTAEMAPPQPPPSLGVAEKKAEGEVVDEGAVTTNIPTQPAKEQNEVGDVKAPAAGKGPPPEAVVEDSVLLFTDEDDDEEHMETVDKPQNDDAAPKGQQTEIPLLDYLCALYECSLKELQLLMYNVQARKRMITHLKQHCHLRTAHLRPAERNQWLHAHDLSAHNVNRTYACGGYLELTVRQYFYAKHGLKLKHPYLPCLIEFGGSVQATSGGGIHTSFYPLEVISVVIEMHPMEQWKRGCPAVLKRARRAVPWLPTFVGAEEDEEAERTSPNHVLHQRQQQQLPPDTPSNFNGAPGSSNSAGVPSQAKQQHGEHCYCCCCAQRQ